MKNKVFFLAIVLLYLGFAISGIRYGLPNEHHFFSYDCDEANWIIGAAEIDPARGHWSPYPAFHEPPFYLVVYGAGLMAAAQTGWLTPSPEWTPAVTRVLIYRRLHLVGRLLQVLFGVGLLFLMWHIGSLIAGPRLAALAALLMATVPGLTAASHFSQDNLPVTALAFLCLALLIEDVQDRSEKKGRWLLGGGFAAGMAFSMKYSAAPLALAVLARAWRSEGRARALGGAVGAAVAGFLAANPFLLIDPAGYLKSFHVVTGYTFAARIPFWFRLPFVLAYPLHYAVGIPLLLLSGAALVWAIRHFDSINEVLLLWLGGLLGVIVYVGNGATPARVLLVAPALCLLSGRMVIWFNRQGGRAGKFWLATALASAVLNAGSAVAIARLHAGPGVPRLASEWMEANIPAGSRIGLPDQPYFWTPDIVNATNAAGSLPQTPFRVSNLQGSLDAASQVDYLVLTENECKPHGGKHELRDFCNAVTTGGEFQLVHEEKPAIGWGPFGERRSWLPYGMAYDDLWAYPVSIYARSNKPAISTRVPSR